MATKLSFKEYILKQIEKHAPSLVVYRMKGYIIINWYEADDDQHHSGYLRRIVKHYAKKHKVNEYRAMRILEELKAEKKLEAMINGK